jgi:transposase
MLRFDAEASIYLKTGCTDMRKSINGLSAIVVNDMDLDPFISGYFVFCNKSRRLMKIIYWDKTGFALWYKRLEKNKFPWPRDEDDVKKISNEQMDWLLSGIDFFKEHKKLHFSTL